MEQARRGCGCVLGKGSVQCVQWFNGVRAGFLLWGRFLAGRAGGLLLCGRGSTRVLVRARRRSSESEKKKQAGPTQPCAQHGHSGHGGQNSLGRWGGTGWEGKTRHIGGETRHLYRNARPVLILTTADSA